MQQFLGSVASSGQHSPKDGLGICTITLSKYCEKAQSTLYRTQSCFTGSCKEMLTCFHTDASIACQNCPRFYLNMEMSVTTPFFGLILYVMKRVAPHDTARGNVFRSGLPFLYCNLIAMVLMLLFPAMALWCQA